LEIEILGPLVVRVGGSQVRLGPTLRVLMLALLCARGGLVPAARLADMLSETGTPRAVPATLRSHVSHLRRALSDAGGFDEGRPRPVSLLTDKIGGSTAYALRVHHDRIDASRFEVGVTAGMRELHQGRFDAASEMLAAAVSMRRGQPLADVADRAFAQAEIVRLEGSYRAARLARVQADVQRGLHRAVIGELEAMTGAWPDDEMVSLLLVICLYRSGRSADAARVCRAAIEVILGHGLDSRRLAALQLDVLSGTLPSVGLPHMPTIPGPAI
jgi:DNA-binding SARP family transcriptional activator